MFFMRRTVFPSCSKLLFPRQEQGRIFRLATGTTTATGTTIGTRSGTAIASTTKTILMTRRSLYTMALAREVSPDIANAVVMMPNKEDQDVGSNASNPTISLDRAVEQHAAYLATLRSIVPTICLPALSHHPDGVFVEDTMVLIPNKNQNTDSSNGGSRSTILMTQPGHESRRGEVLSMMEMVQQLGYSKENNTLFNMVDIDPEATLDGGDVLYTGRHVYVGLSSRTNERGFNVLKDVIHHQHRSDDGDLLKVIPVPMPNDHVGALHLKSVVTCLDDETLLAPPTALGHEVLTNMLDSGGYETVFVPSMLACNVVVVNGHVLVQQGGNGNVCDASKAILQKACQERNLRIHWVDTSELAKVDGALTCCSVLLQC